ncbi:MULTISPECIES: hypothetical protein [Streptomyces]|uniref:hypothetical protein n=1 Tax=Streptomyces TaxID=1883 RepID=UPI000A886F78|nr:MULTISPECIES: hypothetical protein [Streptomyces]MCH0558530.1 hypothetical protein [Streptomyces sp. MUM 16J]
MTDVTVGDLGALVAPEGCGQEHGARTCPWRRRPRAAPAGRQVVPRSFHDPVCAAVLDVRVVVPNGLQRELPPVLDALT